MIVTLGVHASRAADLLEPDTLQVEPAVPLRSYVDSYGNQCQRLVTPAGVLRLQATGVVMDHGQPDPVLPALEQVPVDALPEDTLLLMLSSRYCESDLLNDLAWSLFDGAPTGWGRVQAICDFVHRHVRFDYGRSSPIKSALTTYESREGVCRDFAHMAIAFCRCMNIPAPYGHGLRGLVRGLSR